MLKEYFMVKFLRYNNVVVGEVLEMPEKYRGVSFGENGKTRSIIIENFKTKKGERDYEIASLDEPGFGICGRTLFLRGKRKECDNLAFSFAYPSAEDAQIAVDCFCKLIAKKNEKLRGIYEFYEKDAESNETPALYEETIAFGLRGEE